MEYNPYSMVKSQHWWIPFSYIQCINLKTYAIIKCVDIVWCHHSCNCVLYLSKNLISSIPSFPHIGIHKRKTKLNFGPSFITVNKSDKKVYSYTMVVYDLSGDPIDNQVAKLKTSILPDSGLSSSFYMKNCKVREKSLRLRFSVTTD